MFDAGHRHQITLVSGIYVNLSFDNRHLGPCEFQPPDRCARPLHPRNPVRKKNLDPRFTQHIQEHALDHPGLKKELRLTGPVNVPQPPVDLPRDATNRPSKHVLGFRGVETAGVHSADV